MFKFHRAVASQPRTGCRQQRTASALVRGLVAVAILAVAGVGSTGAMADGSTDMMPGGSIGRVIYKNDTRYTGSTKTAVKSKGTQVASLGSSYSSSSGSTSSQPKPGPSLSGGGNVKWVANAGCLDSSLKSVIYQVAANVGPVTVNSTCRSAAHNKKVGGAPKSYHLTGSAADIRVHGNVSAATAFLSSRVGGFKHYGGGLYHIDTGPRRPMG